ncbi:DUF6925 family protein [Methylobacterium dankookense]|uniref:Uncharacterized protein n=1 Tax=Methylobacterium dankookense TaxID=560405 RepID=A0A564G1K9_9HYPH|nr:hypothetical protein [Methylobacterium dankookense]GJD58431.1 hypothetical protein IFDJLNFL_4351 [Methylobacterium dankookense]VUF13916.1 hypothetical protein MTDSW087_03624 [Methylobacterium dankookense]
MAPSSRADAVAALLREALADSGTAWSLGSFGAIAEFMRDPDEAVSTLPDDRMGLATARGAIALTVCPALRPVAYETSVASGWNHAVALCLPDTACAMSRRGVVTELGPDRDAAREQDRDAILFDLGLGLLAVDACVRTRDAQAIACLRSGVGQPLFDHANPIGRHLVAMSPHRVFLARVGRIEVYAPIPGPDGTSPEGPHTHVLPKLLRSGRTHAATTPIPAGWVPCAGLHPAHPYKDMMGQRIAFDTTRYGAFQALLDRWGDPDLLAVKRGRALDPDSPVSSRHAQAARRVAEVQARYLQGEVIAVDTDADEDEAVADET